MAITLVDSPVTNTGSGQVVLTLPAGVQEDDVVYVAASCQQTSPSTWSEGSGTWQLIDSEYSNDSLDNNLVVYRKVMGASPDTDVTLDGSAGTSRHSGVLFVLRGVDTTTPEDATATTTNGVGIGTPDNPSITTVTAGAWVIAFAGSTQPDTVTNAPTNYVNLAWIANGADNATMGATREIASAGPEDPAAWTDITGTGTDSWTAITVAVRPAGGGGGGDAVGIGLTNSVLLQKRRLAA